MASVHFWELDDEHPQHTSPTYDNICRIIAAVGTDAATFWRLIPELEG